MQVLWLKSDYVDPPDTGGKIRTYNLMRELNRLCQVTYIALRDGSTRPQEARDLPWAARALTFPFADEHKAGWRFIGRVLRRMASPQPYIVQKYLSPGVRAAQADLLREAASSTDGCREAPVVLCDFLEMANNVDWNLPCRKILFQHNVESVIWRRYVQTERNLLKKAYFLFEYLRLSRYERRACQRFDLILAVSERDKQVLRDELGVTTPIEVIETGVDTEFFARRNDADAIPGRLLFLGSLDWMPNIDGIEWFMRQIYPAIKQAAPNVTLDIVGRRPVPAIQSLADEDPSVQVHGSVDDVRPYLARADLFVVPLRVGSGTRLKIFEAFAAGLPVVSTTIGAEGLPVVDGRHLALVDQPLQYADAVVGLLRDAERKRALAQAGYDLVTQRYSWRQVAARLHELCADHASIPQRNVCLA